MSEPVDLLDRWQALFNRERDARRAVEARLEVARSKADWLVGFLGVGEPANVEYLELAHAKARELVAALTTEAGNRPTPKVVS